LNLSAQDTKQVSKQQENSIIEGLSMSNPVSNGKVYIATKNDADKEIIIFDLLGKANYFELRKHVSNLLLEFTL
jgi:hypothetical protein